MAASPTNIIRPCVTLLTLVTPSPLTGGLLAGLVGCEGHTLLHQIEHFPGMVILTTRGRAGLLDLTRLPKLRLVVGLTAPNCLVH